MPVGDAMGEQAGDRGAAGMVRAEDLTEKDPQGDERRVDAVEPCSVDRGESVSDEVFGEHVSEREFAVLKVLPAKKVNVAPEPSMAGMRHHKASLPRLESERGHQNRGSCFFLCHFGPRTCQRTTCHSSGTPPHANFNNQSVSKANHFLFGLL